MSRCCSVWGLVIVPWLWGGSIGGCSGDVESSSVPVHQSVSGTATQPNVLLVTVDTLRADRLGFMGYSRPTSPLLDAYAADGVVFEKTYASASWTPPSMASIMTGLYPSQHGIDRQLLLNDKTAVQPVLPDAHVMLAELLKGAGYRTYAVVTNHHMGPTLGFEQGFDSYRFLGMLDDARPAVGEVSSLHHEMTSGVGPWFLWVHLLDPHGPYRAHSPWTEEFDAENAAKFADAAGSQAQRLNAFQGLYAEALHDMPEVSLGSLALATVEALYDGEVRFTDLALSKLTSMVADDNTLFVMTADHGEAFREGGNMGHRRSLTDDQIHVPWLMHWKNRLAPQRISVPVSVVDVMPTVVELVTGEAPNLDIAGQSHAPALLGQQAVSPRILFAEARQHGGRHERAVIDGDARLVVDVGTDTADLRIAGQPTDDDLRAGELRQAWAKFEQSARVVPPIIGESQVEAERIEMLRAMGYVDEGAQGSSTPRDAP